MGEIRYVKLDTPELLQVYLHSVVRCYQDVYAAAPWNEWMKCPRCNKQWGIAEREKLTEMKFQHCGRIVDDFWPRDELVKDMEKWQAIPGSSFWIAVL